MKPTSSFKAGMIWSCLLIFTFSSCKKNDLLPKEDPASTDQVNNKKDGLHFENWKINTVVGNGAAGYSGDGGPAKDAILNGPAYVNLDDRGNMYISDLGNNVIRKVDGRTGTINTVAGNGVFGFSGDGGPATEASLGVAFHNIVDNEGNLIISDLANHRIRKVNRLTGIINTIIGTGIQGFNGDGHKALETDLNTPMGIRFDNRGNLLFSDDAGLRIRKMDMRTKIITTIAGNGERGFSGDGGPAVNATLNFVWNMAVSQDGDIYFGDADNYRIRKVDGRTGIITTIAGNGLQGSPGKGGALKNVSFTHPVGIAFDDKGDLYISDEVLEQVYKIDKQTRLLTVIAGTGVTGFSGDGGPAANAMLSHPNSLSADHNGNIFINDGFNNRIRKLSRGGGIF